jgi:prophage regulatory protein
MHTQSPSLRPKQAAAFLGIGLSTLWRWSKEREDFPRPIQLGPRTTVFEQEKLAGWREAQAGKVEPRQEHRHAVTARPQAKRWTAGAA